jgi:hypothetical protein
VPIYFRPEFLRLRSRFPAQTSEIVVLDDERETEREEAAELEVGETAPVPGEQVRP